jgi:hypothetical protein
MKRARTTFWRKHLQTSLQQEQGIETIEWIAMAAVIALVILGMGFVLLPGGQQVGQTVSDGILCWAGQIGGGGGGCGGGLDGGGPPTGGSGNGGGGLPGGGSGNGGGDAPPPVTTNDPGSNDPPGFLGQVGGFFVGIGEGVVDTLAGIGTLVWDGIRGLPITGDIYGIFDPAGRDAVRAKYGQLWDAFVNDPGGTLLAMGEAIIQPMIDDWNAGRYGEVFGRGIFEIGMIFVPGDEVGKAGWIGRLDAMTPDEIIAALSKVDKLTPDEVAALLARIDRLTPDQAAQILAKADNLTPDQIAALTDIIVRAATKNPGAGTTVLGHFPAYVDLAKQLNANYLDFPPGTWDVLTDAQRWAINQKFIDDAIARGDDFILATPPNAVRPGSYLDREIQYLLSQGYVIVQDNGVWKLVKP